MKNKFSLSEIQFIFDRIKQAPKQRVIQNFVLNLLIFVAFEIVNQFVQAIVMIVAMLPSMLREFSESGAITAEISGTSELLLMLFLTAVCIALCFLYCLVIERRPIRTMGLTKRRLIPDYLIGAVIGVGMMGAAVMLSWAGGGLRYIGAENSIPWGTMLAFLCAWMIQGFSEELNFRGFFMMTLGTHNHRLSAVIGSSVLFAAAHLLNDGISVWAVCNLTLFGLFAALYFLRTDSIWGIAAIHSMWNASQGNVFGLKVSGINIPATFLHFEQTEGHTWLNGGAFGPEGGAAVTVVLLIGVIVMFLLPQRKTNA